MSEIVKQGNWDEANLCAERVYGGHRLYASVMTDVAEVKVVILREASPTDLTKIALKLIEIAMKGEDATKTRTRVERELERVCKRSTARRETEK